MGKQKSKMAADISAHVQNLENSWSKSLKKAPKCTAITIAKHLEKCGEKKVGQKGYKFFLWETICTMFSQKKMMVDFVLKLYAREVKKVLGQANKEGPCS